MPKAGRTDHAGVISLGIGFRMSRDLDMFEWLMRTGKKQAVYRILGDTERVERLEACGGADKIYRVQVPWTEQPKAYERLMRVKQKGLSMAAWAYSAIRESWEKVYALERAAELERDWSILLRGRDALGLPADEDERRRAFGRLKERADRGENIDYDLIEANGPIL